MNPSIILKGKKEGGEKLLVKMAAPRLFILVLV